ncbi:MAG: CRISPR-associated protein Cas4 [Actinomycetota bacterium]|nr:CRISPR-associated protein Cas4 [Actinomycetota bacterium]
MFSEDDFIPISSLQHLVFCERRAALIYLEGIWDDNPYTIEGIRLHERAHTYEAESRGEIRIVRGLPLRSLRLGLSGKADVLEFHDLTRYDCEQLAVEPCYDGIRLEGVEGIWRPFPVEYKRGKLRHEEAYEVQLCAQALCVEEMLEVSVPKGALYYGKTGRRLEVSIDEHLRKKTEAATERMHELISQALTPSACYSKKCDKCSLIDVCLPKATSKSIRVDSYIEGVIKELE